MPCRAARAGDGWHVTGGHPPTGAVPFSPEPTRHDQQTPRTDAPPPRRALPRRRPRGRLQRRWRRRRPTRATRPGGRTPRLGLRRLEQVGGNIRCTNLTQTSNRELKTAVAPLQGALDKIMLLRSVSYAWSEQAPEEVRGDQDIGFIADEVDAVLPEIVAKDEHGKAVGDRLRQGHVGDRGRDPGAQARQRPHGRRERPAARATRAARAGVRAAAAEGRRRPVGRSGRMRLRLHDDRQRIRALEARRRAGIQPDELRRERGSGHGSIGRDRQVERRGAEAIDDHGDAAQQAGRIDPQAEPEHRQRRRQRLRRERQQRRARRRDGPGAERELRVPDRRMRACLHPRRAAARAGWGADSGHAVRQRADLRTERIAEPLVGRGSRRGRERPAIGRADQGERAVGLVDDVEHGVVGRSPDGRRVVEPAIRRQPNQPAVAAALVARPGRTDGVRDVRGPRVPDHRDASAAESRRAEQFVVGSAAEVARPQRLAAVGSDAPGEAVDAAERQRAGDRTVGGQAGAV
ncbi:MAG: tail fiber domain-containing protein, partial [Planctomycetes bacterium]|nr:tail fiber domain-containing protein [Planctomycetota bacterium]